MKFDPGFPVGTIIDNQKLRDTFGVGMMVGMRRSVKNNLLVIITDHTKGLYDDKWIDGVLHYTGMGKVGDQELGTQYKTLAESNTNGVEIHLLEVFRAREYTYMGTVKLVDEPYQANQKDDNGNIRKVWIFPVAPEQATTVPLATVVDAEKSKAKQAERTSGDKLKQLAKEHSGKPSSRSTSSTTYIHDPYVTAYAKARAKGICQLCGKPAPFKDKNGDPYLECHHIVWLSKGGEDSIDNTVALCPNCHKRMHILNDPADVSKLKMVLKY